MVPLAKAQVWHYYISFVLVAVVLLVIIGIVVGYLSKVTAAKYGRR